MAKKKKFKKLDRENGTFVEHIDCINPECGSSDAMAVYEMKDGTFSCHCFSCQKPVMNYDRANHASKKHTNNNYEEYEEMTDLRDVTLEDMPTFESDNLKDRGLTKTTLEQFGVKVGYDEAGDIDTHFYPVSKEGVLVGYRVRQRFSEYDKEVEKKPELLGVMKKFKGKVGEVNGNIDMFGQMGLPKPSNDNPQYSTRVILCEGEVDAMSIFQLTAMKSKSGNGYNTLSVPSGANVKAIKAQLEYLQAFDEIYLCFDNDKVGKELTENACKVLPVGKVKIINLPEQFKDANDMIKGKSPKAQQKGADVFWKALWNAEAYTPVGLVSIADCWDEFKSRGTEDTIPFPPSFGDLNDMYNGGIAAGEITFIAAPTSAGKSTALYEMLYHSAYIEDTKVGVIMLEGSKGEMLEKMMSIKLEQNISNILPEDRDWETLKDCYKELSQTQNLIFADHHGSMDTEDILDKIEFMANGLDCKMVMLDPIQLALSGASLTETEEFMSDVLKLVKRTGVSLVIVSHVRKSSGGSKDISEGGRVTESDLKGSSALIQVAFNTIILERDKVNDDPVVKNTTRITVWKSRRTGKTGDAGTYFYNNLTGRLEVGMSSEELNALANPEEDDFESGGDAPW